MARTFWAAKDTSAWVSEGHGQEGRGREDGARTEEECSVTPAQ